jgi:hypothetical protein
MRQEDTISLKVVTSQRQGGTGMEGHTVQGQGRPTVSGSTKQFIAPEIVRRLTGHELGAFIGYLRSFRQSTLSSFFQILVKAPATQFGPGRAAPIQTPPPNTGLKKMNTSLCEPNYRKVRNILMGSRMMYILITLHHQECGRLSNNLFPFRIDRASEEKIALVL